MKHHPCRHHTGNHLHRPAQQACRALALLCCVVLLSGCASLLGMPGDASSPPASTSPASSPASSPADTTQQPAPLAPGINWQRAPAADTPSSSEPQPPPATDGFHMMDSGDFARISASSWMSFAEDAPEIVFQYRFDEIPGEMLLSCGYYQTGEGIFYRGPYEFDGKGNFTAQLTISDFEEPEDNPVITIHFTGECHDTDEGIVRFTLLDVDNMTDIFEVFNYIYGEQRIYERY